MTTVELGRDPDEDRRTGLDVEGQALDTALAQVEEHANDDWIAFARHVVTEVARSNATFIVDAVWEAGLGKPPEARAIGAVMQWAQRRTPHRSVGEDDRPVTAPPKTKRKPAKKRQNATKEADRLFSLLIRAPGRCVAHELPSDCSGGLQCAHGFSRRYRAVRWDRRNAFPLCQGAHVYYTHRPLEWDDWLHERWGEELYREIRDTAQCGAKPDIPALVAEFRQELALQ